MSKRILIASGVFVTLLISESCGKKIAETSPVRKDITETVFASGSLDARDRYQLTAASDGYLLNVNFEEGDTVTSGQLLAEIENTEIRFNTESSTELYAIAKANVAPDAPLLSSASHTIAINKRKMDQDSLQLQRYQRLLQLGSIARNELENIQLEYATSKSNYQSSQENYAKLQQQARQDLISSKAHNSVNHVLLKNHEVRVQQPGRIYIKYKQAGDYVRKGEAIASIGNANLIYAKVNIDESTIEKIKLGQDVLVALNTNRKKILHGRITSIAPSFDEGTQSFTCDITFTDTPDFSIINTPLQSNIIVAIHKNAMLIPRHYLDAGGYVQIKGNKEKTKVETAIIGNDWVQVTAGIDEKTILITDNIASNNVKISEAGAQLK